jgi:hypothetical protein
LSWASVLSRLSSPVNGEQKSPGFRSATPGYEPPRASVCVPLHSAVVQVPSEIASPHCIEAEHDCVAAEAQCLRNACRQRRATSADEAFQIAFPITFRGRLSGTGRLCSADPVRRYRGRSPSAAIAQTACSHIFPRVSHVPSRLRPGCLFARKAGAPAQVRCGRRRPDRRADALQRGP